MSRLSKESGFGSVASTSQEDQERETPTSASNRTLNVTLLSSEWKSTKGGLSTINKELAIQLAKHPDVEVSVYLPPCSEEDKKIAARHNVQLIEAEKLPGLEPVLWLASVPENHAMDCVIGHGVHHGRQIPLIKRQNRHCKWIQIVHTAPEDLGMYKTYGDAKGEEKLQTEIELCEMADQVVAVGPKLADAFSCALHSCQKEVITLMPGIFTEFSEVKQTTEERNNFVVLVFGHGDSEDFELKGYDIAAKAIAELNDMSCHLIFVGVPSGKKEEVREKFLDCGVSPAQLTVRCFDESREGLAKLLCEVDLAIMPSRTEGFGLTALEALSAGLPVLVSGNSGLGQAFKKVATGSNWIVASDEPKDWARAIDVVRQKDRDVRLEECEVLREKYGAKFSWQKQCYSLVETMQKISMASLDLSVECESAKLKGPSSQTGAMDSENAARPKEGTKETITTAVEYDIEETVAFKEGKPSDRELNELAGKIGTNWNNLGLQLGISQDVLDDIQTNERDKPYQMLRRWINTKTLATPYGDLYQALCHYRVGLDNLAKEFCLKGSFCHGVSPSSVRHSQLLFVSAAPAHEESSNWKSQTQSGSSRRKSSAKVKRSSPTSAQFTKQPRLLTAGHKGPSRIHVQPSVHSTSPSPSGTKALNRKRLLTHADKEASERGTSTTFLLKRHRLSPDSDTGHVLSVFLRMLKAEYNRRSLLKPLPWENTFKLPLEDVYTRLSIVSRRKSDFKLESGEVNMYDIFKTVNKGNDAMVLVEGSSEVNMYDIFKTLNKGEDAMVLVEGSPGIGKTTFCLKISYDWTNEKIPNDFCFPVFELVLLLKCRDIHGDIMEAISEQLLPEDTDKKIMKEIMDYIKDIHNQEKILIILDGLDELPKMAETDVDKLLYRRILPFCYVLATSRQERGIVVRQKVDFDILLQIEGFTKQNAFEYIRKHFSHSGSESLLKGDRLIKAIKENAYLHALPNNPLTLLLLCVVFEDYHGELPSFRTELYQIIIRCLLRRYCAKHNLEAPGDDQTLEKLFEDSLLVLGELAWRCLQEDRFSFREEELAKFESKIKDLAARKLGLVSKEASLKRINPQHEYHFFHKTFQEFLAATYLAHKLSKEGVDVFCEFELSFKEHVLDEYRQVFLFASGILGKDAGVLFKQIGETLVSEGWDWLKCSQEEATFFTESVTESRNAEQMAGILCSFIPFPVTVEIVLCPDGDHTANILIVAEAWRNFPQLQHPVHLTIETVDSRSLGDGEMVANFLVSCPKLQTFSFRTLDLERELRSMTALFKGLSENSTICSFTFRAGSGLSPDMAFIVGGSLAANKTLTAVTFELINECNGAWASALERGLSATSPLTSVVLKIYGSLSTDAIGALKRVLCNRSLTSLTLIVYGELQDSLATSVGETLLAESILQSLTLVVYGKVSYSGATSLERGFVGNSASNSLEVKVFGELPDNWVTVAEKVLEAKKTKMSVAFYPDITGTISKAQVTRLCPGFELRSLTLNLWGKLSLSGADTLCNVLITSSTSCVTLNIHGKVTDNVAECLVSYLKPCNTMSSLSINVWGELTRGGSSALQELACNKKYLFASDPRICNDLNTAVSLTVNDNSDLTEDWRCGLADGLAKNTSLTTLSLTYNKEDYLREDWVRGLADAVGKNTSLTTLSLTLNNYFDRNGDWLRNLAHGLGKNTSLTTLSVALNNCSDMHDNWRHVLADGLGKNTSLNMLSLSLNDYRWIPPRYGITTGRVRKLPPLMPITNLRSAPDLGKNNSLTRPSITLNNHSHLSKYCACDLADDLGKNTSLTTLSLTLDSYSCLRRGWALGLVHGLWKNTSLTRLSLTLNNHSHLSKDWTFDLADYLGKNTSLTTLSLTLNSYSCLRRDWAHDLADGLAKNTSLTTLSLTLNNYSDLTGDWAHDLGDGVRRSKSLTVVNVTVTTCIKMSEEWLYGLCDSLAESNTISDLSFTLNDHSGTSEVLGHNLMKYFADCKLSPSLNLTVSLYGEAAVS